MRTTVRSIAIIVTLVLAATACGRVSQLPPPSTATAPITPSTGCRTEPSGPTTFTYADRPGVDPDLTSLDVYMPSGCDPVPVVVWVHGGGWQRGDKSSGAVGRKAEWANSLGAALVSVNYRLSTDGSGVRWPDHSDDVAAAVAWVQRDGPSLGLDTSRLTLLGHSAGAQLVAIVGTDPSLLADAGGDPAALRCVIPLDFSFDLATAPGRELVANAFGSDPAVLADASPNVAVERNGAPTARFLVGTRGGAARVAEAQDFVDLIERSGGTATLLNANPYDHDEISVQLGAPGETIVTPAVSRFVTSCNAV